MPQNETFIHKLLGRLERLDRNALQSYLKSLTEENSRLHTIFNQLGEGIILCHASGRILFANRQASLWLGLPTEIPTKAILPDLTADAELARFFTANLSDLKSRRVSDIQILVPRENTLRVILHPLNSEPAPFPILILLENISAQSEHFSADAQQARIESLASLAGGIAHEIGNPLNSISIHLELLKKSVHDLPESKQKLIFKTLSVIHNETQRLDRIVRNFLKATRKTPLRFKLEDLNQILENALHLIEPELSSKKIKLSLKLDKSLPLFLLDPERLHQAFLNLLKNSMEAMPEGGNLWVSLQQKEKMVSILFKDNGKGISPEHLPHIFDAYFTTKEEGSGLGLMNVYQAVREHGGRIDVTSKPGKGSLFVLHLPIRQPKLQLP